MQKYKTDLTCNNESDFRITIKLKFKTDLRRLIVLLVNQKKNCC